MQRDVPAHDIVAVAFVFGKQNKGWKRRLLFEAVVGSSSKVGFDVVAGELEDCHRRLKTDPLTTLLWRAVAVRSDRRPVRMRANEPTPPNKNKFFYLRLQGL
jgi:hypothetical protein